MVFVFLARLKYDSKAQMLRIARHHSVNTDILQNEVMQAKELHLQYEGQLIVLYCTEHVHESLEANVIRYTFD